MTSFNNNILILALYVATILVVGSFISTVWLLMLIAYFTLFFTIWYLIITQKLTVSVAERIKFRSKNKNLFLKIGLAYPIFASILRYILDISSMNTSLLNRLEHIIFSIVLAILFYIAVSGLTDKKSKIETFLLVFGLVVFFGNLNEFFEFFIRDYFIIDVGVKQTRYYSDTIYDLMMNIIGGVLGIIIAAKLIER